MTTDEFIEHPSFPQMKGFEMGEAYIRWMATEAGMV